MINFKQLFAQYFLKTEYIYSISAHQTDVGTALNGLLWLVSRALVIFLLSQGASLSFNLTSPVKRYRGHDPARNGCWVFVSTELREDIRADDWQTYPGPNSSDTYKHKQEELDVYSQKF